MGEQTSAITKLEEKLGSSENKVAEMGKNLIKSKKEKDQLSKKIIHLTKVNNNHKEEKVKKN